jgi:hypothetical protein
MAIRLHPLLKKAVAFVGSIFAMDKFFSQAAAVQVNVGNLHIQASDDTKISFYPNENLKFKKATPSTTLVCLENLRQAYEIYDFSENKNDDVISSLVVIAGQVKCPTDTNWLRNENLGVCLEKVAATKLYALDLKTQDASPLVNLVDFGLFCNNEQPQQSTFITSPMPIDGTFRRNIM